jgi:hypothetical protein
MTLADAMGNEPCGLEGAAKGAVKLVAADARLAGRHQEHRLQPMAHRYVACLEHGANLHSERLAALVALVSADPGGLAAHLGNAIHAAVMRAHGAIRPDPSFYESVGGGLVMEVQENPRSSDVDRPQCDLRSWRLGPQDQIQRQDLRGIKP